MVMLQWRLSQRPGTCTISLSIGLFEVLDAMYCRSQASLGKPSMDKYGDPIACRCCLNFPHLLFVPWSPNYNAKILNPNQAEAAGGFGEGRAPVQVVPPTTDLATELLAEIGRR